MKKIITILFICLSVISKAQVAVTAGGGIAPTGSYSGYYGTYLQGATKVVFDTTVRNAIPSYYRDTSTFMVYTKADSSYWILSGGTANNNYKKVSQFGTVNNSNAFINGGNSFGANASIGLNDNYSLSFLVGGYSKMSMDNFGIYAPSLHSDYLTGTYLYAGNEFILPSNHNFATSCIGCSEITGLSTDFSHPYYVPRNKVDSPQKIALYYDIVNNTYTSGYGLNLSSNQFKVDSNVIMPKIDSNYLFITPTYFNANKGSGSITGNSPTISSSTVPFTYWNGTNHIGYTSAAVIDTVTGNITGTGAIKSSKGLLDSTSNEGIVTPTQSSLKLNKSNFIDSLTGRNATLLGNTTTGTGSTIVLSGSPTLTLPNISAINVSGRILSLPTGGSGTVALRGDTGTYFYPYSSNPKTYTTLSSLSATRNVSTGSVFTYNSATGAYNLDTTRLNAYTAGSNITITSNVISADTTTGATKLATQGYVARNSSSGGLTGSGTVSSSIVPLATWSSTNSRLSSTGISRASWDTINYRFGINNSSPLSLLSVGSIGYAGSLVSSVFSVGGGTLGTSAGNTLNLSTLGAITTNQSMFNTYAVRHTAGSGFGSAGFRQQVDIDGTSNNGGSIFYNSSYKYIGINGYNTSNFNSLGLEIAGNVAISGSASGAYPLAVYGTPGTYGFMLLQNSNAGSTTNGNDAGILFYNSNATNGGRATIQQYANSLQFFNNTTETMRLFNGGRLFVGTSPSDDGVNTLQVNGSISLKTAGNKINIATGTNASVGTATLSSGTVTVSTTAVTASSIIMLALQNCSNCGTPYISAKTGGTSFVITSSNGSDASLIAYQIIN